MLKAQEVKAAAKADEKAADAKVAEMKAAQSQPPATAEEKKPGQTA